MPISDGDTRTFGYTEPLRMLISERLCFFCLCIDRRITIGTTSQPGPDLFGNTSLWITHEIVLAVVDTTGSLRVRQNFGSLRPAFFLTSRHVEVFDVLAVTTYSFIALLLFLEFQGQLLLSLALLLLDL